MPTGYTTKLMEKGLTFEEFVWTCARAFSACIALKDDPLEKLPPEQLEPSDRYLKMLEAAEKELEELTSLDHDGRISFGEKKKHEGIESCKRCADEDAAQDGRFKDMEMQVRDWEPPSPDHQHLKKFMLQQLRTSSGDSNYWNGKLVDLEQKTALNFFEEVVQSVRISISHNRKQHSEEVKRVEGRNQWLRQLRESVQIPEPVEWKSESA